MTFSDTLRFLATNLRWSWHSPTTALFERLDPPLWQSNGHNPIALLDALGRARIDALAADADVVNTANALAAGLRAYLDADDTWYLRHYAAAPPLRVAYFSAEFAIAECLRIYSGGLGVLAGDHLKSASDLGVPLVAVGLLYREGYFMQSLDEEGRQTESYPAADFTHLPLTLERRPDGEPLRVDFPFRDRRCYAQVWRADVGRVKLYLLDTDIAANIAEDRRITDRLYGGDSEHRLRQEIVLGIGGMRALRALGAAPTVIHLNEGHAAFAAVERVRGAIRDQPGQFGFAALRMADNVVFTTHTPVPAGHDFFATHLMEQYLGGYVWEMREPWARFLSLGRHDPNDHDEPFNMTLLALRLSGRANGVSRLHGEVSRKMWNGVWPELAEEAVPIGHITNGVHLPTWVAAPMASLYDDVIGTGWHEDTNSSAWQRVLEIPDETLWNVRRTQRTALVERARHELERTGHSATKVLDPEALTIVFARRFATYKRATLLLSDPERLTALLNAPGRPVQFIFAGKAHPRDEPGKEFLHRIVEFSQRSDVRHHFLFIDGYDVDLARALTAGADVWLNVPRKPYEASGTSGMKAAANGALNLSIPDGWWAEAWDEHNNLDAKPGWSIDAPHVEAGQDAADAEALFRLLEEQVVPLFYDRDVRGIPTRWCDSIRSSLRQLVPFFNTHRMVCDYVDEAYLPATPVPNGKSESPRRSVSTGV